MNSKTLIITGLWAVTLGGIITATATGYEGLGVLTVMAGLVLIPWGLVGLIWNKLRPDRVASTSQPHRDASVGTQFEYAEELYTVFWLGVSKFDADELRFGAKCAEYPDSIFWGVVTEDGFDVETEEEVQ